VHGHFRALPWRDVPAFMTSLRLRGDVGARLLEFVILTASRSGEVRGARWSEFNLAVVCPKAFDDGQVRASCADFARECLDHLIIGHEDHLREALRQYADYYNRVRTHLSLAKDVPRGRRIERQGPIISRDILGGLHHHYRRI
jgi:integrase